MTGIPEEPPLPWRNDEEEQRKARQVGDESRRKCAEADAADRALVGSSARAHPEDENGFVNLRNYKIPGMAWTPPAVEKDPPKRTPYRPDLPLPWLEGRAS